MDKPVITRCTGESRENSDVKGTVNEKINPCPRCGGKAKIRYQKPFSWVECKKCGVTGTPVCDWWEETDGKKLAIDFWNGGNDK